MNIDLKKALEKAVAMSKSPGAVALVGDSEHVFFEDAVGWRQCIPQTLPASVDTIYDLASLTKPIATTTAILQLRDAGKLDLEQPVSEIIPIAAFRSFTIRHLLTHTSGLPGYALWYKEIHDLNEMIQRIAEAGVEWEAGTRRRYSDFGFILLGKIVELTAGDALDAYCTKNIFSPLGMHRTSFVPPKSWQKECAPTEQCPWRKRLIQGEVHDEHASAMGGVAGHAGLFSTVQDLSRFCRAFLEGKVLSEKTLTEVERVGQVASYLWQGLGWQLDPWSCGASGFLPTRRTLGHTGWTGTALWIDRTQNRYAILLSNTCHPSRKNRDNQTLRQIFFHHVAAHYYSGKRNVHTGIDRLAWDYFAPLRGKRIGVLTNHAAVDQMGRSLLDVLRLAPDITIKRLFSPEHGFRGQAEAGEHVATQTETIPVVSLYGKRKQPTAEEVSDLDYLIVDLPDIGARYYTYMATMKACMETCAKTHTPMIILDRPNPVGGAMLEGPIATDYGKDVCCAPIPIRHGMTLGELALYFKKTFFSEHSPSLQVIETDNWYRALHYEACSLPWVAPSPNIPDPQTALVYLGTCLCEGLNLNEGRGTETPFRLIGAPWLDAKHVLDTLQPQETLGFELHERTYTPRAIPGKASHPQYQDEACHGIFITLKEPQKARPLTLAVALIVAMHRFHKNSLKFASFFDTLAGGEGLRTQIQQGKSVLEIQESWTAALAQFDRQRPRLYPTLKQLLEGDDSYKA